MASLPIKGTDKYYFKPDSEGKVLGKAQEIAFSKCTHRKVKYENGVLRCGCGAAWTGPQLAELEKLLRNSVV